MMILNRICVFIWVSFNAIVAAAFTSPSNNKKCNYYQKHRFELCDTASNHKEKEVKEVSFVSRRSYLTNGLLGVAAATSSLVLPKSAFAEESIFAPKFVQQYEDFTQTPEGWSYRIVKDGPKGEAASTGDRVVFDWSGYTIGYFGRPFEAKGGPQGGAFDKDLDYSRTVIGSGSMVKGVESALIGMKPGDIRQVVVPYGPLSYPPTGDGDAAHDKVGPKPTTFSGQRALNFVLDNPRVDRTLLFNVKVIRVDKPNGKGGFVCGA